MATEHKLVALSVYVKKSRVVLDVQIGHTELYRIGGA